MFLAAIASLLLAQLAAPATINEDRLQACLQLARTDPPTAIATASEWLEGTSEVDRSFPQQCLGFAFTSLLRWDAAREAFVAARDARSAQDFAGRARLGAMAGNAALAASQWDGALTLLDAAQADALAAQRAELAGSIASDRARALVALDRPQEAAAALQDARSNAPQDASVWLLSAALARRQGDLPAAQGVIQTASALDPDNAAIGVEAGLIAAMGGFDEAARASWSSVIALAGETPEAEAARDYLQQLDGAAPSR